MCVPLIRMFLLCRMPTRIEIIGPSLAFRSAPCCSRNSIAYGRSASMTVYVCLSVCLSVCHLLGAGAVANRAATL